MNIHRTKIICTIGPATASFETLSELYEAGMSMVRINMSHSNHASALQIINWVKTLNRKIEHPMPVMLDTQGPEIRTGVKEYSEWPTVPQLYVAGEFVGGCDIITEMAGTGELYETLGIELPEASLPTFEITDAAVEVLRDAPCASDQMIRISISKDFRYEMNVGPINANDFEVKANGISIAIDRMSSPRAEGMTIDYETDGAQSGFRIKNPNEPA